MRKPIHPTRSDLISTLSVENVNKKMHSGNYTCAPSNAKKTSIMVHVVDGKYTFIFQGCVFRYQRKYIQNRIILHFEQMTWPYDILKNLYDYI